MSRGNYRVLIVDDEQSFLLLLKRIVQEEGYTMRSASGGEEALKISEEFQPHLILTDLKMPGMDGLTLMETYMEKDKETDFIVLTAYATIDTAIRSMKMGALEYILKPLKEPEELRHAIHKAFERRRLLDENLALRGELDKDIPPLEMIFAGMESLLDEIKAVAPTNSTVLLLGETGTGKSLIAKVIHNMSGRKGPFVEVNCAAVPENLLESEFFGHEKGAFTGALSSKKGKCEIAATGTIFLDEISEMDRRLQAKLLRVLQDGSFERVGSNIPQKTDARVICATNKALHQEVADGRFREDLFFRLNVFPLKLKPLRERRSHIATLSQYLARTISRKIGRQGVSLSEQSIKKSCSYDWPGNIRELENILERAIILFRGGELDITTALDQEPQSHRLFKGTLKDIERKAIEETLRQSGGNRKKTAASLGLSLRSLQYKIKEYEIEE